MLANIDIYLLSVYYSKVYKCSKKEALNLIKKAIVKATTIDATNDYDVIYSLCEEPVPKMASTR